MAQNPFPSNELDKLCSMAGFEFGDPNCTCEFFKFYLHGKEMNFCPYAKTHENSTVIVFGNITLTDSHQHSSVDVIYAVITMFASLIGVFGNVLVVLAPQRRKLSRHQMLVNSLAICDLIFAGFAIVYVAPRFWTNYWLYREGGCKFLTSIFTLGSLVAIGMIFIIAIERYFGIVHPLKTGIGTKWRLFSLCFGNILMAVLVTMPRFFYLKVKQDICGEEWDTTTGPIVYSWTIMIVYFIIPLLVISILYRRIHIALQRSTVVSRILSGMYEDRQRRKRIKDNRKTTKYLVVVLLAFFLFTFPNKFKWLIFDMVGYGNISKNLYRDLDYLGEIMYFFHVVINPLVYTAIDKRFRKDVKEFFLKRLSYLCKCFYDHYEVETGCDVTKDTVIGDDNL